MGWELEKEGNVYKPSLSNSVEGGWNLRMSCASKPVTLPVPWDLPSPLYLP